MIRILKKLTKPMWATALGLALGAVVAPAQSLDDLNIQLHGYATQGFLYSTNNNLFTTSSSNGSPAWTEAVVNVGAQPIPKLRIGVQARYELLGNLANEITLDWAAADYKANDKFGVRFGKVKVPSGLFNEISDIDPSYQWALLPQSVYPLTSRNSQLATYGGVFYGTAGLPGRLGKLEYRGWSGAVVLTSNDGYFVALVEDGFTFPNGLTTVKSGGALHWKTPLSGLMVGASLISRDHERGTLDAGSATGKLLPNRRTEPDYFAKYEKDKLMVAAEINRIPVSATLQLGPGPGSPSRFDFRGGFAMATYKVTGKLTVGAYNSEYFDKAAALGPARYSKDWTISGRYDFNQFLYAKAEEHFIEGTDIVYDADLNPNGLKPNTKLTILKVGVSF